MVDEDDTDAGAWWAPFSSGNLMDDINPVADPWSALERVQEAIDAGHPLPPNTGTWLANAIRGANCNNQRLLRNLGLTNAAGRQRGYPLAIETWGALLLRHFEREGNRVETAIQLVQNEFEQIYSNTRKNYSPPDRATIFRWKKLHFPRD